MKRKLQEVQDKPSGVKKIKKSSKNYRVINLSDNSRNGKRRLVILDGSNVAFFHSNHNGFSVRGLEIAIQEIQKMGHPNLVDRNLVRLVCNPKERCFDDDHILQQAINEDAAVISNDNYLKESRENSEFRRLVETRVIPFLFVRDKFMLPVDPYGEHGPSLTSILNP